MTKVTFEVPDAIYRAVEEFASKTDRKPAEILREAVEIYRQEHIGTVSPTHSVLDIKPALVTGVILQPWTSRSELLENFFDDRS